VSCIGYLPSADSYQAVKNTESVEELPISKHISHFVCADVYTDFVSCVWTIVQIYGIFRTDMQWSHYSIVRIYEHIYDTFYGEVQEGFQCSRKTCTGLEKN
jgi:hypothetical protein